MIGNFQTALKNLLEDEGGFSNDKRDPGGITNLGITLRTWQQWQRRVVDAQEMRNLTADQVTPLYRENYWNAVKGDQLPNGVDYLVFDFAVNAGVRKAIQTLQKVLEVKTDGVIGPVTLTAIKEADPEELIREFTEAKEDHYKSLDTFEDFGEGWMARSERVEQRATELCG